MLDQKRIIIPFKVLDFTYDDTNGLVQYIKSLDKYEKLLNENYCKSGLYDPSDSENTFKRKMDKFCKEQRRLIWEINEDLPYFSKHVPGFAVYRYLEIENYFKKGIKELYYDKYLYTLKPCGCCGFRTNLYNVSVKEMEYFGFLNFLLDKYNIKKESMLETNYICRDFNRPYGLKLCLY